MYDVFEDFDTMTRTDRHAVPPAYLRTRRAALFAPPSGLALAERSLGTLDYVHHCDALTLLRALPSNYINTCDLETRAVITHRSTARPTEQIQ